MPTWTEQLPAAIRTEENNAIFDKYETIGDFAADYLKVNSSLSALNGEKSTFEGKMNDLTAKMGGMYNIPTAETTPEEKRKFLTALGVPESASDYGLDEETGKTFMELGFTKDQATNFMEQVKKTSAREAEKQKQQIKEAIGKYDASLGDKKDITYKLANDALDHFYDKEDLEVVKQSVFSSPKQIEINARIGGLLKERPGLFVVNNNNKGGGNLYDTMDGIE